MTTRLLALAALGLFAAPAAAQIVPGWNYSYAAPYYNTPPWPQTARFQTIGYLPNGIRVIDPWNRTPVGGYYNPAYYGNPYLYNQQASYNYSYSAGYPGGSVNFGGSVQFNNGLAPGFNPWGAGQISREPGRFTPLGPDAAYNPASGTLLRPQSGVAYTQDGVFHRQPGTGTMTAFGAYLPGSGLYVNPFSGQTYNPQTGLIVRP